MMKYYQVTFADAYDPAYHGVLRGFYTSKEEAEKAIEWEQKHPDPYTNFEFNLQEIDLADVRDKFVPPMTDEEYDEMMKDAYEPQREEFDLPNYYYDE